ncbi:hypothetical protein F8S20_35695 [Nostoc sp. BAE]|nr:hypothetical protein [Nostoc commune BAE]
MTNDKGQTTNDLYGRRSFLAIANASHSWGKPQTLTGLLANDMLSPYSLSQDRRRCVSTPLNINSRSGILRRASPLRRRPRWLTDD